MSVSLKARWDDPRVQAVYKILCDTTLKVPRGEHWEGHTARLIVAALFPPSKPGERP
jgi:hypothetical protein